jgi:hypothetical protein
MTTFHRLVSLFTQGRKGAGFFQRIFSLIASYEGIDDVQQIGLNKYAYADPIVRGLGVDFLKDVTRQQQTRIARMHNS